MTFKQLKSIKNVKKDINIIDKGSTFDFEIHVFKKRY